MTGPCIIRRILRQLIIAIVITIALEFVQYRDGRPAVCEFFSPEQCISGVDVYGRLLRVSLITWIGLVFIFEVLVPLIRRVFPGIPEDGEN